eukprot:c15163_g1_i2 orf=82-1161(+)
MALARAHPSSHAFAIQLGILNHLQILDLASCRRVQRCKLRNMVEAMSLVGRHGIDFEAKGGEGKLDRNHKLEGKKTIAGTVVALGKFDALHVGHRALAVQASKVGPPVLLSFTGMAEVLGWEKRLPIVAPCDRKRIMSLWASVCSGIAPLEYHLEFAKVRSLSPREFVERLAKELLVKGVVAGANYRFGYKAAGNASDLVQLCGKFGLEVCIVDTVMDETQSLSGVSKDLQEAYGREKAQVSSTRVRKALSIGDMRHVTELLGREHRLVLTLDDCVIRAQMIHVPISSALNQVPMDGTYSSDILLSGGCNIEEDGDSLMVGFVKINNKEVVASISTDNLQTKLSKKRFLCLDLQVRLSD